MAVLDCPHDRLPFEAFVTRVEPKLWRHLARYRIPRQDAEDLVQQSLVALVDHWHEVHSPEAWILGVLKRHCLMYWRRQRRQLHQSVDTDMLEWLADPVRAPQEREELLRDVRRALERLPERCRAVLELRFALGYAPLEVAERLGYRRSSIGKVTSRCLRALVRELALPLGQTSGRPFLR